MGKVFLLTQKNGQNLICKIETLEITYNQIKVTRAQEILGRVIMVAKFKRRRQ